LRYQPIIENVQKFVLDRSLQKAKSPLISRGEENKRSCNEQEGGPSLCGGGRRLTIGVDQYL
jgi:hypothetical protein